MERKQPHGLTRCPLGNASITTGKRGGIVLLCTCFLIGCSPPSRSFNALLAKIDASPDNASIEVFKKAADLAQGTEEKLRLLKRASIRDASFFADISKSVISDGSITEAVALVALDAFIEAGRFSDAIALFEGAIDPKAKSSEFMEVLVLALREDQPVIPSTEQLVICADTSSDSRFLVLAATESLKHGDKAQAGTILDDIFETPLKFHATPVDYSVPIELLWDAGVLVQLSETLPDFSKPLYTAICADAAYMLGKKAEATSLYAGIIERFPLWSWKPYTMLARGAMQEPLQAQPEWPYAPASNSYDSLSQPAAVSQKFYAKMVELFGDEPDVVMEQSRWLYELGHVAEARELARSVGGEKAAVALLGYLEPERVVPGALRLAADYADSLTALDASLRALCKAKAWNEFQDVYRLNSGSIPETRLGWFWKVISDTLAGDLSSGISAIRKNAPQYTGFRGVYDLGMLEFAAGRLEPAYEAFMMAAKFSSSGLERAKALVMAGDVAIESGDEALAQSMYMTALGANSDSRDARARLERVFIDD